MTVFTTRQEGLPQSVVEPPSPGSGEDNPGSTVNHVTVAPPDRREPASAPARAVAVQCPDRVILEVQLVPHTIEPAATGRSRCRACGRQIASCGAVLPRDDAAEVTEDVRSETSG